MGLACSGTPACRRPARPLWIGRPRLHLVVLLVGMAIVAIWMSAALPAWRQQVQRQREDDLIFRGEQYARAIVSTRKRTKAPSP